MKIIFLFLLLTMSLTMQAGERLKGISESMNDSFFSFNWFSDDEEEKDVQQPKKIQKMEKTVTGQHDTKTTTNKMPDQSACIKQKVYSLNVKNPEQYKRLEDYPYTYECVTPH